MQCHRCCRDDSCRGHYSYSHGCRNHFHSRVHVYILPLSFQSLAMVLTGLAVPVSTFSFHVMMWIAVVCSGHGGTDIPVPPRLRLPCVVG